MLFYRHVLQEATVCTTRLYQLYVLKAATVLMVQSMLTSIYVLMEPIVQLQVWRILLIALLVHLDIIADLEGWQLLLTNVQQAISAEEAVVSQRLSTAVNLAIRSAMLERLVFKLSTQHWMISVLQAIIVQKVVQLLSNVLLVQTHLLQDSQKYQIVLHVRKDSTVLWTEQYMLLENACQATTVLQELAAWMILCSVQ